MHFPHDRAFSALLFDMDGTLITSTASAERVWERWAARHGIDAGSFLPTIHGVRSEDTIAAQEIPGIDIKAEAAWIESEEIADVAGVAEIPGAAEFLALLPPERWAIVTSASLPLARRRLGAAGIALPKVVITAEDVSAGKPNPEGYLLAARRLGVDPTESLVFEDAPAGIAAGRAAGAAVLTVGAGFDYRALSAAVEGGRIRISL